MSIIVTLIIYLVVLGLIYMLVNLFGLPDPFAAIIRVLFILLAVLVVLSAFGIIGGGLPHIRI